MARGLLAPCLPSGQRIMSASALRIEVLGMPYRPPQGWSRSTAAAAKGMLSKQYPRSRQGVQSLGYGFLGLSNSEREAHEFEHPGSPLPRISIFGLSQRCDRPSKDVSYVGPLGTGHVILDFRQTCAQLLSLGAAMRDYGYI